MSINPKLRAFTLVETLVVISIILLVVTITFFSFNDLNNSQAIDKTALATISVLNEARALTLSSREGAQYGVHINSDQVVLFKGNIYNSSDVSNKITLLNPLTLISTINLVGGGSDVIFDRLTGATLQTGTLILSLKSSPSTTRTVTILGTGIVNSSQ
jgi:type II secretory pathway pseudopilin PulG